MGLGVGKGDGSFVGGGVEPPIDVVGFEVLLVVGLGVGNCDGSLDVEGKALGNNDGCTDAEQDDSSNAIVRGLFPPLYLPLELVLPASVVFVAETTLTWISASVIQLVLSPSTLTL